jgi:hypothetical protein
LNLDSTGRAERGDDASVDVFGDGPSIGDGVDGFEHCARGVGEAGGRL